MCHQKWTPANSGELLGGLKELDKILRIERTYAHERLEILKGNIPDVNANTISGLCKQVNREITQFILLKTDDKLTTLRTTGEKPWNTATTVRTLGYNEWV
jgi:hypothetical protein